MGIDLARVVEHYQGISGCFGGAIAERPARSIMRMSFVNKLFGIRGTPGGSHGVTSDETANDDFDYDTINNCPYCHQGLQGWGCVSCNVEFVLEDNTRLVERGLSQQGAGPERQCERCDRAMTGGEFTAAWENGNNPDAYITCPHCRHRNVF